MLTPDLEENTEKLSTRARALINAEFRSLLGSNVKARYNNQSLLRVSSPPPQSASKSSRARAVKTARKKIQEEWDALKNATIISNNSMDEKTSQILVGVVAYIEINNVPKSTTLKVILQNLGATVKDKFTPEVTHVIFKKGTFETFKKAKLWNVNLVSVLWIEACRDSRKRISEELFPVAEHKDYTSPRTFRKLMELNPEKRDKILRTKNIQNKVNEKRNLRSSDKSGDSSESVLVLQISTDESGKKHTENKTSKEINNPAQKKRLFASVGDEMIDENKTEKKNMKTKRKLFTNRHENSSLNDNTSECSETTNIKEKNPYQVPSKKIKARKKNNMNKKQTMQKRIDSINSSDSTICSNNSTLDNIEQVRELIKLTQSQAQTAKKVVKVKKVRENKLTKEEKENIKKANKIARQYNKQTIKASQQTMSCRQINVCSKTIKNPSLVSTYFHKQENKWLRNCLDQLGGFTFKAKVEKDTTHIVVGQPVRTINLLKGICRGCWLLDKRWVQDSFVTGHWLAEYDYELTDYSKAVQRNRLERQILGDNYHTDILNNVGTIYIGKNCLTKIKDLKSLIALCDGKQVSEPSVADIVVGEKIDKKVCISEQWLLDSITAGKCKNLKKYTVL